MKYEYRIITLDNARDRGGVLSALNTAGADGWEALDFQWHTSGHLTVVAKREVEEKKDPAERKAAGPALNTTPPAPVDSSDA
jgi:hypothetical protein